MAYREKRVRSILAGWRLWAGWGLLLGLLGAGPLPGRAQVPTQVQVANTVVETDKGCILLVCGTVSSPTKAVDGSEATAATITAPLAVSSSALRVGFGTTVPAGALVKVLVSFTGNALNVGLLDQTSFSTYASTTGASLQQLPLSGLVSLSVLNTNTVQVEFPATASFKQLEIRTGGALNIATGGYGVSVYQVTATVAPLPVELLTFAATARAAAVGLSWQTASERNSAYFVVERTAGAQDQYQAIGQVAAAGNSTQPITYHFADNQPLALGYYRLRQVDSDGRTAYSPVVLVRAAAALAWQSYPNPVADRLTITGPPGTRLILFNHLGQTVQSGTITLSQSSELDLRGLPDGGYFLRDPATGRTSKIQKIAGGGPQ